jgi:hypothetical protein
MQVRYIYFLLGAHNVSISSLFDVSLCHYYILDHSAMQCNATSMHSVNSDEFFSQVMRRKFMVYDTFKLYTACVLHAENHLQVPWRKMSMYDNCNFSVTISRYYTVGLCEVRVDHSCRIGTETRDKAVCMAVTLAFHTHIHTFLTCCVLQIYSIQTGEGAGEDGITSYTSNVLKSYCTSFCIN